MTAGIRLPVARSPMSLSPTPSTPTSDRSAGAPAAVTWTDRLEGATALDPLIRAVKPLAGALVAAPEPRHLLRAPWRGPPLHPPMTDVPIGFWTSAVVLDLLGGA